MAIKSRELCCTFSAENTGYNLRDMLLGKNQGKSREENEFYPYRYLASEGFLPGYNFTKLPQLGSQQPWIYNPERRAVLRAELDVIFAHLYGLTTEDLRYILAPEDVCGKGCINETIRVLKDNELRQYGEYRTKRLVLEAWNKLGYDN